MDGCAPLLSDCGIVMTKQVDSCTGPLQTRAGIRLASPGDALAEHSWCTTIRCLLTLCARAGVHDLARPKSSADYQAVYVGERGVFRYELGGVPVRILDTKCIMLYHVVSRLYQRCIRARNLIRVSRVYHAVSRCITSVSALYQRCIRARV